LENGQYYTASALINLHQLVEGVYMKKDKILLVALITAVISITGFTSKTFAHKGKMIRIATVPAGSEVAGLAVNNVGELFFNAQHPGGKGEVVGDGPAALIGYIDGMDIRKYSGKNVSIPDEASRSKVHVAAGEYVILGKSGQKLGDGTKLGAVYDSKGELMYISNDVDYNAFIV
jgi:hypothetical protein